MAFIGTPLDTRNTFQSLQGKRFNGDGSTTAFTLDVAPSSTLDIEVFVGNVRQDPNTSYTLSGTTLTFTGAPPSGTNNIYVVHQAKAVGTIDLPEGALVDLNGGSVDAVADQLVLEANSDMGMTMLAATSGECFINFGDSGSSTDAPAFKITQRGGYAGMEIEGDATNTGTAALVIDASGSGDSSIDFQNAGNHKWRIKSDYSDSHRFYIMDADTSAWVYLDQNDTSFNSSSDERLKTDWVNITNATDKINTLTKVGKFKRKQYDKENNQITDPTSTKEHYGLSAQEVEAILPEIVNEDVNGIKGMSYTALVPLLVKAIQELSARVKTLEE